MRHNFTVCIFCGSSDGHGAAYANSAQKIGTLLGKAGIDIVYGGGKTGLMGKVADAALEAGGKVIGVIPTFLRDVEVGHDKLTRLIVTDDMHTRKRIMYDKADLFVSLPGGIGTFDETIEVMTWLQLRVFSKKLILFDVNSYWEPFIKLIKNSSVEGFSKPENMSIINLVNSTEDLMEIIDGVLKTSSSKIS